MDIQDIYLFLKFSIFQFLLKKNIFFYNKDRDIFFHLICNNKEINVQNEIHISLDNSIIISTCISIKNDFLSKEELVKFTNFLNEYSGIYSCYIKDIEEDENFSLLYIKSPINLIPGTCIDEKFWENQLVIQMNNVSSIVDFIFYDLPKSDFYKNKDFESLDFKVFFCNSLKSYVDSIKKIVKEENKKKVIDYNKLNKKELEIEVDKELDKFLQGNKNLSKLKRLSAFFKKS